MLIDILCVANHFEALARKSEYRNIWSFITGLYQKRVLLDIDVESRYDDRSDQACLKASNLCHFEDQHIRVFFTGIDFFCKCCVYSGDNYL